MSRDVKHAAIWPMLLLFLIYPYVRHSLPGSEPREELRALYLARAVTEHFALRINEVVKEHGDLPGKLQTDNDQFAPGAPGLALLSVGPLLVAKACAWVFGFELTNTRALRYLRVVLSIIPTCIVMLALFAFMVRRSVHAHAARFAVLAYALSAPVWVCATGLSAAHLAGLCLISCVAVLGDDEDWPSQASFAVAGMLAALAVMLCYLALPLVMMIAVYAFTRARSPQLVLGYLFPIVMAVASLCLFHWYTLQTVVTVIEAMRADGSMATSLWGFHAPNWQGFGQLFFSNLGLLRWAPVFALVPIGLFFMVSRGDVAEATLLGAAIVFVLIVASGSPAVPEAAFGASLLPLALALSIWPLARATEAASGVAGGSLLCGVVACWSLLQGTVLLATHVFAPETFANPLRDLSVAMVRDGIYAQTLGHGVGLHGDAAVAPLFFLAFLVACTLSLGGAPLSEGSGWRRVVSAIIFGGAVFYWQLSWSPEPHRRERYLDTLAIERNKESTRAPDARVVRNAARLEASEPGTRDAKLARGHAATAFGDNATALEQYRALP